MGGRQNEWPTCSAGYTQRSCSSSSCSSVWRRSRRSRSAWGFSSPGCWNRSGELVRLTSESTSGSPRTELRLERTPHWLGRSWPGESCCRSSSDRSRSLAPRCVVHSHRPRVPRLERLPVDTSYPSGHTAASIAVYGGLVLLLTSTFKSGVFRAFAWTFALAMVTFVATARMYRGMHHPLDVAGGLVVGIAAVIVLVFTSRAAGAAAEARSARGGE